MTSPAIALPFVRIPIDHPQSPAIGQPCRIGTAVGIRTYDPLYETIKQYEAQGLHINKPNDPATLQHIYGNQEVPISFQHTTWKIRVHNLGGIVANPGEIVHYIDNLATVVPSARTHCAVHPGEPNPKASATAGLLLERIAPNHTTDVLVLLQYARRDWHWLSCPVAERTPGLRNGEWVFRGTRLPIAMLFEHLQEGGNIDDFLEDHDSISREQAVAVLQHTATDLAKYADPAQTSPYPTTEAAPNV